MTLTNCSRIFLLKKHGAGRIIFCLVYRCILYKFRDNFTDGNRVMNKQAANQLVLMVFSVTFY